MKDLQDIKLRIRFSLTSKFYENESKRLKLRISDSRGETWLDQQDELALKQICSHACKIHGI